MQHKDNELFRRITSYTDGYYIENGMAPTQREIADAIGLNPSTVCRYLSELSALGEIVFDAHRHVVTRHMQSLRDSVTGSTDASVPLAGTVGCSAPSDFEQYIEDSLRLPKAIFGDGPLYMLHATGDSMVEAGINPGDLVVVRRQSYAQPGQIVVALTPDGTTLKGYYPEPQHRRIRLQPANKNYEPFYYEDITIQGVAVKIIKDAPTFNTTEEIWEQ